MGLRECDDHNLLSGDGCDPDCKVELGWKCEGGSPTGKDTCYEICGDGRDLGEYGCDDGNNIDGDGCDKYCFIETGYRCNDGIPEYCYVDGRPILLNATLSEDGHVLSLYWNTTVVVSSSLEVEKDWELLIFGPRHFFYYDYTWDLASRDQDSRFGTTKIDIEIYFDF